MNGQASLFLSLYLHNKPSTTRRCTRSTLLINIHHTHTLTLVFNSRDLLSRTQRAACHDHIIERCVPNMCECTHTCVWVCQLEVRHPHTHTGESGRTPQSNNHRPLPSCGQTKNAQLSSRRCETQTPYAGERRNFIRRHYNSFIT